MIAWSAAPSAAGQAKTPYPGHSEDDPENEDDRHTSASQRKWARKVYLLYTRENYYTALYKQL